MHAKNLAWHCLEHSPAGIMVLDHELNIKVWNHWLIRASGITASAARGQNLLNVIPALHNSHMLDAIMLAINTGLPSVLTPKLHKYPLPLHRTNADGSTYNFPQHIHILAIRTENQTQRHCLIQINDVSSAFQREQRLRQQAKELEEQKQKLTIALQEAKRANESKNMFLANVSHEIRTPLNAIIGLSNLTRQDTSDGSVQDNLGKIEQSGKLLLSLVNDILDFAKIDAGKMQLEIRCCEIDSMVAQLADMFRDLAASRHLRLIFDIDPQLPFNIETDGLRLQQILINLISNAIKFTQAGEVKVRMAWLNPQEHPDTENSPHGTLELQVQDTGIGMTSAEQKRLFQPFSQADASTSRQYGGTGLGLAITRRLIEMFNGTISLTSTKQQGSCFIIRLPILSSKDKHVSPPPQLQRMNIGQFGLDAHQSNALKRALKPWNIQAVDYSNPETQQDNAHNCAILLCPAQASASLPLELQRIPRIELEGRQAAKPQRTAKTVLEEPVVAQQIHLQMQRTLCTNANRITPPSSPEQTQPLAGLTIMVVEDNAINRLISQKVLERMGATITMAEDGQKALEIMRTQPDLDAILMDIQMPVLDGYATTRALRREPYSYTGAIIALTAHAMSDEPQRCKDAGMDDHVSKPFEPEHIKEVLLRHVRAHDI